MLEERFFEVYNGHPGINHLGDDTRPGDEKIWDIANTLRIAKMGDEPLFGIASDDAHQYHGGKAKPGRGWVMVHAESLSAEDITRAMLAGDLYASSGVVLKSVAFDTATKVLKIVIDPVEDEQYTTRIIGTRRGEEDDPAAVGATVATIPGTAVAYKLRGDEWYVRATISSDAAHPVASFPGQVKQAWTQPVGWKHIVADKTGTE